VLELLVNVRAYMVRLAVLYRPPSSSKTGKPIVTFVEEFHQCVDSRVTMSGRFIIMGDFNFHYERVELCDIKRLRNLLHSLNLEQHIQQPTHIHGHCLDLVISRSEELHVSSVDIHPPFISDHSVITLQIPGKQGKTSKKKISYRKVDSIDVSALRQDLAASSFVTFPTDDVEELAAQYQNYLREVLDHHAPLIQKTITDRSVTPWFTDECKELKSKKRKAERESRSDKSTIRL